MTVKLPAKPALATKRPPDEPKKLAQPLVVSPGTGNAIYPVAKDFGKAPSLGKVSPGRK